MVKKRSGSFRLMFFCSVLVLAGLLHWMFPPINHEGLSAPEQDLSNFTGLVFFTKTKDCDEACTKFNKTVVKIYDKFPNNIMVIDSTDPSKVSATLTKYKVDSSKVPLILSFKNGVDDPYNSFKDYDSLENFLLNLMRTVKPARAPDRAVAKLQE